MRTLWIAAAAFLLLGLLLVAGGLLAPDALNWFGAHGMALTVGVLLLGLEAMHFTTLSRFRSGLNVDVVPTAVTVPYVAGALMVSIGFLVQPSLVFGVIGMLGWVALLVGSIASLRHHLRVLPGRKESVVDMQRDPLTKGDDASWKHARFAHFFLPLGIVLVLVGFVPMTEALMRGFQIAGMHVLGIGYGLLSLYGIGHLWVPRFSGVPAIAAGAIKGELHSTLPAMIFIPLGFILGIRGLVIAGGAFAFLGFFTYMGVLGANIMRNKSPTHRVTPEFVYIPWTFTGIFWLVSGVLMGIFLTVVPDLLAGFETSLRAIHVHINLFGGVVQLLMGWATRIVPGDARPPRFQGAMSLAFYAFNGSVVAALWYTVAAPAWAGWTAIGLFFLAATLFFQTMQAFFRGPKSRAT